jgi:inhibitor of cysteine peptidase
MNHAYGKEGAPRKMTKAIARAAALLTYLTMMSLTMPLLFPGASAAARPPIVTDAQNGKTIVIARDAPLVIALESNPSTGYSWRLSNNDGAIVKFIDQSTFPPMVAMPGAAGHQMFKFKAIAAGSDSIELEYLRPWEKGVAPAKKFRIEVTVK